MMKVHFHGIAQLTPNCEITILQGWEYADSIDCYQIKDELGRLYTGIHDIRKTKGINFRKISNERYIVELPFEIDANLWQTTFMVRKENPKGKTSGPS